MNTGGPIIMNIGWPVVGIFVTLVGLSMAEVASTYPTAGGLNYWAAKLGGKNGAAWSWFTGWFNLLDQVAATAVDGHPFAPRRFSLDIRPLLHSSRPPAPPYTPTREPRLHSPQPT